MTAHAMLAIVLVDARRGYFRLVRPGEEEYWVAVTLRLARWLKWMDRRSI